MFKKNGLHQLHSLIPFIGGDLRLTAHDCVYQGRIEEITSSEEGLQAVLRPLVEQMVDGCSWQRAQRDKCRFVFIVTNVESDRPRTGCITITTDNTENVVLFPKGDQENIDYALLKNGLIEIPRRF